jgi:L-asparaginase
MEKTKKKILILATGGTIAASAAGPDDNIHYGYGQLKADSLLAALPGLPDTIEVFSEDLCQVGSEDMTFSLWQRLIRRLKEVWAAFDAVVITHGTDTMEETAFLLDLVFPPEKTIVLTGAMRPATSDTADGPRNLADALIVAASKEAKGLGVLCVLGGDIWSAAAVRKTNTGSLRAFGGGEEPALGLVKDGLVFWSQGAKAAAASGLLSQKNLDLAQLPQVDLIYACAGMDGLNLKRPAVLAGFGLGTLPKWVVEDLKTATSPFLICGQSEKGRVYELYPGFAVVNLTPRKARVLLILLLAARLEPAEFKFAVALFS